MSDIIERIRSRMAFLYGADFDLLADAANEIDSLRAELAGKEKALLAAKTVIEAKDRAYSVIDQRFAALSGKAATVDSERECNERLTAEIDELRAALAEAQRDAERYRWLRDPDTDVGLVIDKSVGYEPRTQFGTGGYTIFEYRAGDELDAAIDAAILATKEVKK